MYLLHNKSLIDRFLKQGVVIAFRGTILKDSATYSGYKWSSKKGPNQKMSPGMVVSAEVIIEKQSPISLIIPAFKKFLEGKW